MNKDNKHPLDPEELFKRLGNRQAGSNEPLDDFEKEALEGFALLGDEQQARDAYQEVLVRLSKKNSEAKQPERKTRVVWLSAAAIIAVMLIVGIVWLNDRHGAAHEDLAMNTPQTQTLSPAEEPLPAVETEAPVNEPAQTVNAEQKEVSVTSPDLGQDISRKATLKIPEFEKNLEDQEQADEKPQEKLREDLATNGTYARSESETGSYGYSSPTDTKKNEAYVGLISPDKEANGKVLAKSADKTDKYKAKDEEKDQDTRHSNGETVTGNSNNNNVADAVTASPTVSEAANNQQEVVVTKNEGKKRAEKTNDASPAARATSGDFKTAKEQEAQNIANYYAPGEKALKDHLVAGAGSKALSGAYAIKASVTSDGKLKVSSVTATGGHCSDCAQILKKILNGMAGWQPSPELVFSLTF